VTPNMSIVPKKYHTFISPSLRRVFLDAREDKSPQIIDNLNTEIAALKERNMLLERDKVLLTDRCESARSELALVSADQRSARLANHWAEVYAHKDKENLDRLRAEYEALSVRILHGLALSIFFIFVSTMLYSKLYSRSVGPQ
jgi:hypothetical protein